MGRIGLGTVHSHGCPAFGEKCSTARDRRRQNPHQQQQCRESDFCVDGWMEFQRFRISTRRGRRRRRKPVGLGTNAMILLLSMFIALATPLANAAFVQFENCLPQSIIHSNPLQLQFEPMFVWAEFNLTSEAKNLNVTVYGNVTGIATQEPYPPPNSPSWSNPENTVGKIVDVDAQNNMLSTIFTRFEFLSYTPYVAPPARFCDSLVQGQCPLGPVFFSNGTPPELRAFSVSHDLFSSYAFTTITPLITVTSGNAARSLVVCVSADVTPSLGSSLNDTVRYLPLVILILVGIATVAAAMFSPWGSLDFFRWTSNYGRDEDLLRLVTPGFADCLQYIQFIVLTGSLTLNYPGFYQPIVSRIGWSVLMFNQSFVSHGNGTQPLQDGVYVANATYGLDRMRQLIGMSSVKDIWAGMVVWLLAILGCVVLLIQLGFGLRWLHHQVTHEPEEDLRAKNFPFTMGNVIRIIFNFFLLPIVSLSMFQLVVTRNSPISTVALAVVLLVCLVGFAAWLLLLITQTRPRSYMFDDLPTVLLYGPLYNTFSDSAAAFSVVSVLLTFVRGIAIGAVQPSGIAQIVLLAICEVVLIITLSAFRPFARPTSMTLYHTIFAVVRCITMLLSASFVPSLKVGHAARGWIGYAILLMHGMVLTFGFFLNAIQTLVEVLARLAGAGGEGGVEGGAARGGLVKVFGMRQLSRRVPQRPHHVPRHSINSEAAMLGPDRERLSSHLDGDRTRSFSTSSALLLNRSVATENRMSAGFEASSIHGVGHSRGSGSGPYTPSTPGGISPMVLPGQQSGDGGSPRSGMVGMKNDAGPYYRPPRQRRATLDGMLPSSRKHNSWTSGDWTRRQSGINADGEDADVYYGPPIAGNSTPVPAYLGAPRDDSDADMDEPGRPRTDYAVREVDFYYRVRGPALSRAATRKLKTGPADPTGPVSSATGWFRGLFRGKTRDKGKGFEVVRSTRAPPPGLMPHPEQAQPFPEPYHDKPDATKNPELDVTQQTRSKSDTYETPDETPRYESKIQTEVTPPSLPAIEASGDIELPRRTGSKSETYGQQNLAILPPAIPRKSSKRHSSADSADRTLEIGMPPPTSSDGNQETSMDNNSSTQGPQPQSQATTQPTRLPFGSKSPSVRSEFVSTRSTSSSIQNTTDDENNSGSRSDNRRQVSSPYMVSNRRQGRPSSVGFVPMHRASDHIHVSDSTPFSGSSAEIVGEPSSSPSM
ncbi:integral membrane protein [Paracoccidioides lutzii Pb01]|uniref:Integral membrane protein n=1 Tax=Paracoccidioides lutzii (strain ATCC MYA-826 / Pb01) TaxID=502779 RepID=C1H7U0_PARBA|nr:integral membrane protein [Paracoccidioides lutzii Pb01]EEH36413.2 integral membrane protein [Paracoccidioides lutzii Pb01]